MWKEYLGLECDNEYHCEQAAKAKMYVDVDETE